MSTPTWVSGFPNAGTILRSLDSTTIQQVTLPLGPDIGYQTQEFVAVDSAENIWAFHDHMDGTVTLQESLDGGDTWTIVVDRASLPGGAKAYAYGIVVLPSGRLVITAATSTKLPAVAYSDNNGTSWTVVQVSSNTNIYATCCLWVDQNGALWACGAQYYDGNVYKSTDNGATWNQVAIGMPVLGVPSYGFAMLGLANNALFLIVSAPTGTVDPHFAHGAISTNGGTTWTWGLVSDDSGWQTAGRAPVAWDSNHHLYVTCSNGHTYTSPDTSGVIWTDLGFNIPPNGAIGGCFFNGTVLMAISVLSGTGNRNLSYWESSNGGTTWSQNSAMLPNYSGNASFTAGDSQWKDPPPARQLVGQNTGCSFISPTFTPTLITSPGTASIRSAFFFYSNNPEPIGTNLAHSGTYLLREQVTSNGQVFCWHQNTLTAPINTGLLISNPNAFAIIVSSSNYGLVPTNGGTGLDAWFAFFSGQHTSVTVPANGTATMFQQSISPPPVSTGISGLVARLNITDAQGHPATAVLYDVAWLAPILVLPTTQANKDGSSRVRGLGNGAWIPINLNAIHVNSGISPRGFTVGASPSDSFGGSDVVTVTDPDGSTAPLQANYGAQMFITLPVTNDDTVASHAIQICAGNGTNTTPTNFVLDYTSAGGCPAVNQTNGQFLALIQDTIAPSTTVTYKFQIVIPGGVSSPLTLCVRVTS